MIFIIIRIINFLANLLIFIVFIDAILSFILPPYNSIRRFLDRIVQPLLAPIRRVIPTLGGLDFSPLVLIILIEIIDFLLVRILSSL